MWEPWRGCHRCSEGCKYCYIHKGDARRDVDTNAVVLTGKMEAPLARYQKGAHKGEYKMPSGAQVAMCFSTDFLVEDADPWRSRCWEIIRVRRDLQFLFLTKRITRFREVLPPDWGDGYDNVTVGCTVESQVQADERLPVFAFLPIKHRNIICQPMLGPIDLERYLDGVSLVIVGGESDRQARPLDFSWVLDIREQCARRGVAFQFRQTGTHFRKDGVEYTINPYQQMSQARKAGLDLPGK